MTGSLSIRTRRIVLGSVASIFVFLCGLGWLNTNQSITPSMPGPDQRPIVLGQLLAYGLSRWQIVNVVADEDLDIRAQDPVFTRSADGTWVVVGIIDASMDRFNEPRITLNHIPIRWTSTRYWPVNDSNLQAYETPDSLAWVAQTLLPEHRRKQLADSFALRFKQNRVELGRDLEPLLLESISELTPIVEKRVRNVLVERKFEFQELALKYQSSLVQQRLVPLIKQEIMPIVQRRAEPLLTAIGQEIWERASVWSIAWRYFYDILPLTERDLVRDEWKRFLHDEVGPIVQSHTEEILRVTQTIVMDVSENTEVRRAMREASDELFHDPDLRRVLVDSVQSVFSDSEPLKAVLLKHWDGAHGQRFMGNLQAMIEPWLRDAGAELFGTPDEGLTEELIAVLRTQILAKDRRWLVVETCPPNAANAWDKQSLLHIHRGTELPRYPLILASEGPRARANRQSPSEPDRTDILSETTLP